MNRRLVVLLILAWLAVQCSTVSDKHAFVLATIQKRAPHLGPDEREDVAAALLAAEDRTGVDSLLLMALAEEESQFRLRARSHRGALGLLQVRPATAGAFAAEAGVSWVDREQLYDPYDNAAIAATYLHSLRNELGSWDLALTAYNRGPTSARRLVDREPSSRYASRVWRRYQMLLAQFAE